MTTLLAGHGSLARVSVCALWLVIFRSAIGISHWSFLVIQRCGLRLRVFSLVQFVFMIMLYGNLRLV